MNNHKTPLILIIDDEDAILKTLKDALVDEGYRIETLSQGQKALDLIGKLIPDLVLLDIFMPNCNGLTLLKKIKKEYPDQKIMMISGFGNIPIAIEAVQNGAIDFIEKPLNLDEILNKIDFLKQKEATPQLIENTHDKNLLLECGIIGESNLFLELIKQTERLAPHTFPVLIYGEQGTGKTLLSKYIHKKSSLTQKSFRIIDCEIILNLDKKETMFSHFSSKTKQTLFIKNIDKLNKTAQKILFSLLTSNPKDLVRLIVSTRTPLFSLVQQESFLPSLFYLINRAPIEIPPLRKRPYDIPLLLNYYLNYYNKKYNRSLVFTSQSIRLLRNARWPGNITQLKQSIEKLVLQISVNDIIIKPEHLLEYLGEKNIQLIEEQSLHQFESLEQAKNTFEKDFLLYLLRKNYYDIQQISNRLNIAPIQLKHKLLELNIDIKKQHI